MEFFNVKAMGFGLRGGRIRFAVHEALLLDF